MTPSPQEWRRDVWWKLTSFVLHPVKVAIIEAMLWIDEPMSAVDIDRMHDDPPGTTAVAYHLRNLAFDISVLDLYDEETIRGARRKLYFFRGRTPRVEERKRTT